MARDPLPFPAAAQLLAATVCALGLLSPPSASALEGQGFAELRLSLHPGVDGDVWQTVERVRPTFETTLHERVKLVAVVEAGVAQGRDTASEVRRAVDASFLGKLLATEGCVWPEPRNDVLRVSQADDYLDVDRLYLDVYAPGVDLRVGRQSVNWGSARFLNPTDPFPEVLLAEPWRPRRGVNAVRATAAVADRHDATLVVASDDALTQLRTAARVRVNAWATDWALVGAWRSDDDDAFVGIDFRGTLGVGWWLEAAWHLTGDRDLAASAGVDYSFPVLERLVVTAQYTFHGAGSTAAAAGGPALASVDALPLPPCDAPTVAALWDGAGTPDPFASVLSGRDYLLLALAVQALPDWGGSLSHLQNLDDGTGLLVPAVSWQAADWLELAATAQVPLRVWGDGGELSPNQADLVLAPGPLLPPLDLRGLVADAVVTAWVRASF